MKKVFVLSAYCKNFEDDMLEIFDSIREARQIYNDISDFGENRIYGVRVNDPVMGISFIVDYNIREVDIDEKVYEQIKESGTKLISSKSVTGYWGPVLMNHHNENGTVVIDKYVPWTFMV